MMQSAVDINDDQALNKTGDRVRYFLYITDKKETLMINLLNLLGVQLPYIPQGSLLRFDLYHINAEENYEYQLRISFNGKPLTSSPDPCIQLIGDLQTYQCSFLDFVQLSKDQSYYGYTPIDDYIKMCGASDVPSPGN